MRSEKYNNNKFDKAYGFISNAGRKARKKAAKTGSRVIDSFFNCGSKLKKLIIIVAVCFLVIFLLVIANVYSVGETDGQTQQYVGEYNSVTPSKDGSMQVDSYSDSNAACIAYYNLLSRNKSVFQEYVNKEGETVLISPDDEHAVSDYFNHDEQYYISPNLLYCMNQYLYGDNFVYPESFLNPVAYDDETFSLRPLVDENGEVCVTSQERDDNGQYTGNEIKSVADYGIATVMRYKKGKTATSLKGNYIGEDYVNEQGEIEFREYDTPIPFEYSISSQQIDILDRVITYRAEYVYEYKKETYLSTPAVDENGTNEKDNVLKVLYDTKSVDLYCAVPNSANGTSGEMVTSTDYKKLEKYCKKYDYYIVTDGYDDYLYDEAGKLIDPAGHPDLPEEDIKYAQKERREHYYKQTKLCKLYRYRSKDSGIYTESVNNVNVKEQEYDNQYLYDYIKNFSTYRPIIDRSYDTFRNIHSQATLQNYRYSIADSDQVIGNGNSVVEQLYNGSERENLEIIWDGLRSWGYSEIQAAAVMGNMARESGFNLAAENSESGAFGLCQWTDSRKRSLASYAQNVNHAANTDLVSQLQFACMELDTKKTYNYARCQWTSAGARAWDESNNLDEVTKMMALCWERFATLSDYDANAGSTRKEIQERQKNAKAAYSIFSGRTIVHYLDRIDENGTLDGSVNINYDSVGGMTEEDSAAFSAFYHKMDDIYNGKTKFSYFMVNATTDDIDLLFCRTNSYNNGTSLSEEQRKDHSYLMTVSYITDFNTADVKRNYSSINGFIPRLASDGMYGSPWYYTSNIFYNSGYGLPNCTCYAWGRVAEINGAIPDLPTGNAGGWYDANMKTGTYSYGQEPELGAVAVWHYNGTMDSGHVAVVEQINEDGSIIMSNSGYSNRVYFYITEYSSMEEVKNGKGLRSCVFKGFIYLDRKK